ncbi:hypothetical protein Bca4012_049324 [Brassica carinata]
MSSCQLHQACLERWSEETRPCRHQSAIDAANDLFLLSFHHVSEIAVFERKACAFDFTINHRLHLTLGSLVNGLLFSKVIIFESKHLARAFEALWSVDELSLSTRRPPLQDQAGELRRDQFSSFLAIFLSKEETEPQTRTKTKPLSFAEINSRAFSRPF